MKSFSLIVLCFLMARCSNPEKVRSESVEDPLNYFTGFQKSNSIDSSLYFARKLAVATTKNPITREAMDMLLDEVFIYEFKSRKLSDNPTTRSQEIKRRAWQKVLLGKMATDTNKILSQAVRPIYYWVNIMDNQHNTDKQGILTRQFINEELNQNDFYKNKTGRFALSIYKFVAPKAQLKVLANQLFDKTNALLLAGQAKPDYDTSDEALRQERAYYRYLYAYIKNIRAKELLVKGDVAAAEKSFQQSFNYRPDQDDLSTNNLRYEISFLTAQDHDSLPAEYLDFIEQHTQDKRKILNILQKIALMDPTYKSSLSKFYTQNFSTGPSFSQFWITSINSSLKSSTQLKLKNINGSTFSTAAQKGKWILMDFWGTWCNPCRKEHPALQKYYEGISTNEQSNITFMTIACRDNETAVKAYMAKNKYSFPVSMADNQIEKAYKIIGYPLKVLVSPQGKFVTIPYSVNWIDFVKGYTTL